MSKRWITLCLAGCFGVALGIAGMGTGSVYAGSKKLAMEGAVFDLTSSSSTTVYGYVSDKAFHPVSDATVTVKSTQKGKTPAQTQTATSDAKGSYSVDVESGKTYSLSASKDGLGRSKAIKLNITKNDTSDHIANFQFKKASK